MAPDAEPWKGPDDGDEHRQTKAIVAEHEEIASLLEQAARRLRNVSQLYLERLEGRRHGQHH